MISLPPAKETKSLPQTMIFYIFKTQYCRTYKFQTLNSMRSEKLSFEYQRFTPSGCKDKDMIKDEFVSKTQFLCKKYILRQ